MSIKEIRFSPKTALESVLYIASSLKQPTIHEVLKIRYFADKLHLSKYGWLASGDDYVAMKFGPVASGTYNLIRAARGDQSGWIHPTFSKLVEGALAVEGDRRTLVVLRKPDPDHLSSADKACVDEAVLQYGNMQFEERTDLSHDEAWKAAWATAAEDEVGQSPISIEAIAGTLPNAKELVEHIRG